MRLAAEGIDATLDIYPYEYWQSTMTVALPERDFNDVAAARFVLANTIKPEGIRFTTYDADPLDRRQDVGAGGRRTKGRSRRALSLADSQRDREERGRDHHRHQHEQR